MDAPIYDESVKKRAPIDPRPMGDRARRKELEVSNSGDVHACLADNARVVPKA